jgi:hypothetical protein
VEHRERGRSAVELGLQRTPEGDEGLGTYREQEITSVYTKLSGEQTAWVIHQTECVLAEIAGAYHLIPTNTDNDAKFDAIGPFETLESAAVAAALME